MEICQSILKTLCIGYAYHKVIFDDNNTIIDLIFLNSNKLFNNLIDLNCKEIINKNLSAIIPAKSNPLINIYKKFILKRKEVNYHTKIKFNDKYYHVKMYFEDEDYLITVVNDITDQMLRMHTIIIEFCDNIKSCILVIDPKSGKIRHANNEACSFYGYSLDEISAMNMNDFTSNSDNILVEYKTSIHEFSIKPMDQLVEDAVNNGRSQGLFLHKIKSNDIKQVLIDLTYIYYGGEDILFAVIQDKTEMFNIARKLHDNEIHYKTLFDEAPLGYQSLDKDGNILDINQEWLDMLGYEKHEVIGRWFGEFLPQDNISKFKMGFSKFKKTGSATALFKIYRKDGQKVIVDIKTKAKYDELGNFKHSQCILSDISSIVKAQKKEKALNKSKNEFLAMISHEVRTPLTTILGLNQLMMHTKLDKTQKDYLNKISNAGNSLLGIINDMLDITKYESGKLDIESLPFSFNNFMENIITINKMRAEKNGNRFEYECDKNIPPYLIGDALRFGQVINNILGNAIKFTHMGKIKLKVRLIGRAKDDADIQIIIRDNGIGMSEEQVEKLFKPFEQADTSFSRKYGGSGLGMAISKQLIDLMGGEIKVDSILGEGTIFIIDLNLHIDKSPQEEGKASLEKICKKEWLEKIKDKKVLVVEDHKINRKIICDLLSFYDLDIQTASNGTEALDKVRQNCFDLILMDIQMPIMDGLTATKQIRQIKDIRTKNTPILAMTAHAMKEEYTKSLESGMNGHLTKPINIKILEENLIKYLAGEEIEIRDNRDSIDNIENELIDIRMGLLRFRHDANAYKSSLNEFLEYKDSHFSLIKMLKSNKLDEANRYLHSIKGIAGNLSINQLSRSADELKSKLSTLSKRSKNYNISVFSDNLQQVINAIESKEVFDKIDMVMLKYAEQ